MQDTIIANLFVILFIALLGGVAARFAKLPVLIGYLLAGLIGGALLPIGSQVESLAEIGLVLLLFSVGLELSLSRLNRVGKVAVIGSILQMLFVAAISFLLLNLVGISGKEALVLASGFTLSSTAVVVKMLEDRGEAEAIHGEIMIGWLLTQDLAVIPIIALLPVLAEAGQSSWFLTAGQSLLSSGLIVAAVYFLGRFIAPRFIHSIAKTNSRELLVLSAVALALGTAYIVGLFGVSPALGAFLAGIVISESQENHAVFSETRPLRDLFVVIFFATLGFFVTPSIFVAKWLTVAFLVVGTMLTKLIVIFILMAIFGYRGKTSISTAIGLTQIGEFSFVIFITALHLGVISDEVASVGIATTLVTLFITPFFFKAIIPLWRRLRIISKPWPFFNRLLTTQSPAKSHHFNPDNKGHVIICGYGRMGRWVGKALSSVNVPFVVIDYNQKVIHHVKEIGIPAIYGDPAEPKILDAARLSTAKAIVVAIPDLVTQEEVISYAQKVAPNTPIFARAHLDQDMNRLSQMKVRKVVQPEFEGAVSIIKEILQSMGKDKEVVANELTKLRRSHSIST